MVSRLKEIVQNNAGILVCLSLGVLFTMGCTSPEKRIGQHFQKLQLAWETNLQHQVDLPENVLDWNEAVEMLLQKNLRVLQARTEVTNSQENVQQVYKDLIPTLNARAGISKELADLANITENDITLSADSFFNVPGVLSFASRLYGARLYDLRARTAYELLVREQLIELYRLFFQAEELRDEYARLQMQRATALAMEQVDPFSGRLMLTEMETREVSHSSQVKAFQDRASELLGSRASKWVLSTNGLPVLRYQLHPLPLNDTNRVAQLQLRLMAIELEAARAQLFGMKLRYWPELNIFVTGPPIYQRAAGREQFWDSEEVRASADLFWSVDTRGNQRRLIRQTARQQDLQIQRYRQEMLDLMNRLIYTQNIIETVGNQLARVESQLALLLAVPPAQTYAAFEKYIQDYRMLTQQQLQLKRELSELNALFWFVDDAAWNDRTLAKADL